MLYEEVYNHCTTKVIFVGLIIIREVARVARDFELFQSLMLFSTYKLALTTVVLFLTLIAIEIDILAPGQLYILLVLQCNVNCPILY